ncbi:2-C-methyl-D-erythritol 4-phosphate cytidylyltransferase [Eubacterium ruminantium]|nr:2-C-methyl-D-erythritol 4-phosphate cytidylyltransferase [Eubacterium ruminantium]
MVSAIVLAAGSGSRMKSDKAKQFIDINGKPLIYYALKVFEASIVDEIILVTRQQDINYMRDEVVKKYSFNKVRKIIAGGKERFDSVENGIKACDRRNNIIMIHDGARPFVTNAMILSSISAARRYKACTVGMPVKDTIKVVDEEGFGVETPDRSTLRIIQTPQTFDRNVIEEAYRRMRADSRRVITDDTMLVERYLDQKVKIVEGSYNNIKVTTPEDIKLAEAILG